MLHDCYLKNLKDLSQNDQNIRSSEMANHLFETIKNSMMLHGRHTYATESDMTMAKMCEYPQSQHALQHWKSVGPVHKSEEVSALVGDGSNVVGEGGRDGAGMVDGVQDGGTDGVALRERELVSDR